MPKLCPGLLSLTLSLPLVTLLASNANAGVVGATDLETIELFRFLDREDGTIQGALPYQFEACVVGTNIASASVTPPMASAISLVQEPLAPTEWCTFQGFTTHAALVAAFPDGDYQFATTALSGPADNMTVTLNAPEPGAFPDFSAPFNRQFVPNDQDLTVTWSLTEKPNGAGCLVGGAANCADAIAYSVFNLTTETEIDVALLGVGMTTFDIDSAALVSGQEIEIEVQTFEGLIDQGAFTDGLQDPVVVLSLYEDINELRVFVPEPAAAQGALLSLASLLGLAAVRRRSPRAPGAR